MVLYSVRARRSRLLRFQKAKASGASKNYSATTQSVGECRNDAWRSTKKRTRGRRRQQQRLALGTAPFFAQLFIAKEFRSLSGIDRMIRSTVCAVRSTQRCCVAL